MHYTGTIWRPPYEASSLLLEATAGCTHHRCKFCTLYNDLSFSFRMSPIEDMEADLEEARQRYSRFPKCRVKRVFLTGANPFVLTYERLMEIAGLIHNYFPEASSIGSFARVTDVTLKLDEELAALHKAGYDGLTIGMETADDEALAFMDKGYLTADILEQCGRLDRAGIRYNFFYLTGISGAGRGEEGARLTAAVCNRLHPGIVGANMLTVYPDSRLSGCTYRRCRFCNFYQNECFRMSPMKEFEEVLAEIKKYQPYARRLSGRIAAVLNVKELKNGRRRTIFWKPGQKDIIMVIAKGKGHERWKSIFWNAAWTVWNLPLRQRRVGRTVWSFARGL